MTAFNDAGYRQERLKQGIAFGLQNQHGAFGKRGEAFHFHSGAGAVPVLLTQGQRHRYALTGKPAFDEGAAIADIETFIEHLWSGARTPAKIYIFSELPSILTHVLDGTYAQAMPGSRVLTV